MRVPRVAAGRSSIRLASRTRGVKGRAYARDRLYRWNQPTRELYGAGAGNRGGCLPTKPGRIPIVFDARTLSLAFPGHPDPGDGERLRTAIAAAPGVILATPEYHGSFCAMTKLIIENLGFPSVLAGKPVALVGVAAGRIGAI